MTIESGYIYHIKDKFFDIVNDEKLMSNYESKHYRPTYFVFNDGEVLWFIPLSSKVEKYKKIIDEKIKKYGACKSILIRKIAGNESVILIQNAFPTLEKFIDHPHTINGNPIKAIDSIKDEVLDCFKYLMSLKKEGINLFFTDIDRIKEIMLSEKKETT